MTKQLSRNEQFMKTPIERSLRGCFRQSRERRGNPVFYRRLPRFAAACANASEDKSLARNDECCLLKVSRLNEKVIMNKGDFHA